MGLCILQAVKALEIKDHWYAYAVGISLIIQYKGGTPDKYLFI